jgi:porin
MYNQYSRIPSNKIELGCPTFRQDSPPRRLPSKIPRRLVLVLIALAASPQVPPALAQPIDDSFQAWSADRSHPDVKRDSPESKDTQDADWLSRDGNTFNDQGPAVISANPGAVNATVGTGRLGRLLGFKEDSGIYLGGLWIGNADYLLSGGAKPGTSNFNSLEIINFQLNLDRLLNIPGATFGTSFLQFDGQDSNGRAGVLSGYNGLVAAPPFDRTQLYEFWWRQVLFDDRLILRVGKSIPTSSFNNLVSALALKNLEPFIPAISGLLYTPLFINPSLLGVLPGYYDSAWGITTTLIPTDSIYLSYGLYDGSLAGGRRTGIEVWPSFNGYSLNIGEIGFAWAGRHPGRFAFGTWHQSGLMQGFGNQEHGIDGFYAFATNRLFTIRREEPGGTGSVIGFLQYGINNSRTKPVTQFAGGGLSGFGLIPHRPRDSIGMGVAVSWLNGALESQDTEVITQIYYQAHLAGEVYLQPTFTYVPHPGIRSPSNDTYPAATSVILQLTVLF